MVNWAARGLKPGQAGPGNGNVHGLDASVTCIQSEVPGFELSQHESQQKLSYRHNHGTRSRRSLPLSVQTVHVQATNALGLSYLYLIDSDYVNSVCISFSCSSHFQP